MIDNLSISGLHAEKTVLYDQVKKVLIVDSDPYKGDHIDQIIKKQNHISLGTTNNIGDLERKIKHFDPDVILINLETEGKLDGYQITKILKLDHDIPFCLYFDADNTKLNKWAEELNPNHIIHYSTNNYELEEKLRLSLG